MKAPATPITTALPRPPFTLAAIPNITTPETNAAIDLWSRRIGTVSMRELIFGTTNGATIEADNTAIIASFFNTPDALLEAPFTDIIDMNKLDNSLNKKPSYTMLYYVHEDA